MTGDRCEVGESRDVHFPLLELLPKGQRVVHRTGMSHLGENEQHICWLDGRVVATTLDLIILVDPSGWAHGALVSISNTFPSRSWQESRSLSLLF